MAKEENKSDSPTGKSARNIYIKNLALMAGIFTVLILILILGLNIYTRHNDSIEVPDLAGLQISDADAIISSADLNYEIVDSIYKKDGAPGSILEQIPLAKSKVKQGRTIYLTIQAKEEPLVAIPDLADTSQRQAEARLNALGFTRIIIKEVPSEYQGLVYGVEHKGLIIMPGQKVPKSAPLTLRVGSGVGSETDSVAEEEPIAEAETF